MRRYPKLAILLIAIMLLTPITPALAVISNLTIKGVAYESELSNDPANPTLLGKLPDSISGSVYSDAQMDKVDLAVYRLAENTLQSQATTTNIYPNTGNIYSWYNNTWSNDTPLSPGNYRINAIGRNSVPQVVSKTAYFRIQGMEGLKMVIPNAGSTQLTTATSNDTTLQVAYVSQNSVTAYVYPFVDAGLTVAYATYNGSVEMLKQNISGNYESLGSINFYNGVGQYYFYPSMGIGAGDILIAKSGSREVRTQIQFAPPPTGQSSTSQGIPGLMLFLNNSQGTELSAASSNETVTKVAYANSQSSVTANVYAFTSSTTDTNTFDATYNGPVKLVKRNISGNYSPLATINLTNGIGSYTFIAGTDVGSGDEIIAESGAVKAKIQLNIGSNPGGSGGSGSGGTGGTPGDHKNEVPGLLTNWAGNPVGYASLSFFKDGQDKYTGNYGFANEQGDFKVPMFESGTYNVALNNNDKWINLGTVTVELTSSSVNLSAATVNVSIYQQTSLRITLPEPPIKGVLSKGSTPLAGAWINVKHAGFENNPANTTGGPTDFYWTRTDSQGNFGFDLPDGDYVISDVSFQNTNTTESTMANTWVMINKPFSVPYVGSLNVVIPEPNVRGSIYGIPAPAVGSATSPGTEGMVDLTFAEVDQDGNETGRIFWSPAKWDTAILKYRFGMFLPAGKYKVGVNVKGQFVNFPGEFLTVTETANNSWSITTPATNTALVVVVVDGNTRLRINVPTSNVNGSLEDASGNPIANAWLTIKDQKAVEFDWNAYKWTSTNDLGNFSLFLPNGNYLITEVMKDGVSTRMSREFTVTNGLLDGLADQTLAVVIKGPNVAGVVQKPDGTSINNKVWIGIRKAGTAQTTDPNQYKDDRWVETQPDGSFNLSLPPGSYEVYGISTATEWIELQNKVFVINSTGEIVSDGQLVKDGTLTVRIPGKNVRGMLTRGNEPLAYAWITFRSNNATTYIPKSTTDSTTNTTTEGTATGIVDYGMNKWAQTDANGNFGIQLDAGNWMVDGISTDTEWIPWQQNFNVTSATTVTQLPIAIPGQNLSGVARDENGLPIANGWVSLAPTWAFDSNGQVTDYTQSKWLQTDNQGNFVATLPPGTYRVNGISTSTRWVNLAGPIFTIITTGVENIVVQIPSANVKGIVVNSDGTTPLANAWLEIRPEDAPVGDYTANIWTSTDGAGKFSLSLKDNGSSMNYKITGISYSIDNNYKWVEMRQVFTVTNGQVTPLKVRIPGMNLRGTVYADTAKTQPVANAWISIAPPGTVPGDGTIPQWTGTDSTGRFAMNLAPGTYQVTGISSDKGWKEFLGAEFTVGADLNVNIDVVIPSPNLSGTARNAAGAILANSWLEIRPASAGDTEWNRFKWAMTDNDGKFELILAAGSYVVKGISTMDGYVQLNQAFTVPQTNLEVRIPAPNVTGSVAGASSTNEAWVAIKPANAPLDDWSQTVWTMTKNGNLEVVLAPGDYKFVGISNDKGWTELDVAFTVSASAAYSAGILGQTAITISGNVTINGIAAANVTVGIKPDGKKTRWIQTDSLGNYSAAVSNGYYKITYVVNDSTWILVDRNVSVQGQAKTENLTLINP